MSRRKPRPRSRQPHPARPRRPHTRPLRFEPLEGRRLLAVSVVNTKLDVVDSNDGLTSLREAVVFCNATPGPDTIQFAPELFDDTPILNLAAGELTITEALEIGNSNQYSLGIKVANNSRAFDITATTGDFSFHWLDVYGSQTVGSNSGPNDDTFSGGAIRSATSGSLNFEACHFGQNSTLGTYASGGAVFARGDINFTGTFSQFEDNSTSGDFAKGGAIYSGGHVSFGGGYINHNTTAGTAAAGGGVFAANGFTMTSGSIINNSTAGAGAYGGGAAVIGPVSITDFVSIQNNSTAGSNAVGGAIAAFTDPVAGPGDVTIAKSNVVNNRTSGPHASGGGIYAAGNVTIDQSTIATNSTAGNQAAGGGVYAFGEVTLLSSTASDNATTGAQADGAAVNTGGNTFVRYSTIANNRATGPDSRTGGVFLRGSALLSLESTILAKNTAEDSDPDLHPGSLGATARFSLIGSNQGTSLSEAPIGSPDALGNLIGGAVGGSIDPRLRPLEFNGASSQTLLPLPDSPAVDAGDPNAIPGNGDVPLTDERFDSRVLDGRIDIGALEVQKITVDTLVDENATDDSAGHLSLRKALQLARDTYYDDVITFALSLFKNGPASIVLTHGALDVTSNIRIYGPTTASLTIDAAGNDPTPGVKNGDGSRVFDIIEPDSGNFASTPFLELHSLTLTGGDVDGRGGAILVDSLHLLGSGGILLANSLVVGNAATQNGGAIEDVYGSVQIEDSMITGNYSGANGGAIDLRLIAGSSGGNLIYGGRIVESTIVANVAAGNGGGIALQLGGLKLERSIVASNVTSNPSSQDLSIEGTSYTDLKKSYDLIGFGNTFFSEAPVGQPDSNGNLIGGPVHGAINPKLGPLVNNGGPALSMVPLPGSPVINAGDPNAATGQADTPQFDQRATSFHRIVGGRIDIGAIEVQSNPFPGDYNFDNVIDAADYTVWRDTLGSTTDLRADGTGNGQVDSADSTFWKARFGTFMVSPAIRPLGDYNFNGIVDAADYTVWRDTLGSTTDLRADASGPTVGTPNGSADQADYDFWKSHFGNTLAGSAATASAPSVAAVMAPTSSNPQSEIPIPQSSLAPRSSLLAPLNPQSEIPNPQSIPLPPSALRLTPSTHDSALLTWLATQSNLNQPSAEAVHTSSTHATSGDTKPSDDLNALDTAFATLATSL
jgi:hypothetical protein